jgi:prepilin-type N-terminal cleavage/methylation domain-containing protein
MRKAKPKAENMTREFAVNGNHQIATKRRSGFTLIELLVVIAIIAILAGLTLAGVMVFLRKGPAVQNRHDILQLSAALQQFKSAHGVYPPSHIRLCSNYSMYGATPLDQESKAFLATMWPELGNFKGINWGSKTGGPVFGSTAKATDDTLEGDQCLVFFLGGPPNVGGQAASGLLGFSTNPLNPVDKTTNRKKYFEFEVGRLFNRGASPFASYHDVYGKQPFIYFSSNSNRRANSYDTTVNSLGVKPYQMQTTPTIKFYMPESFQLISAGADGQFGLGGPWTEATATPITPAGKDDVTNFHDGFMGNP